MGASLSISGNFYAWGAQVTLNDKSIAVIRKSSFGLAIYLLSAAVVSSVNTFDGVSDIYNAVNEVPYLNAIVTIFYA